MIDPNPICELLPKPSDAIFAMTKGLRQKPEDGFCEIDMSTFGSSYETSNGIECFGCAATRTLEITIGPIIQANGKKYKNQPVTVTPIELQRFEDAIDMLRKGSPLALFKLYGVRPKLTDEYYFYVDRLPDLLNDYTEDQLVHYDNFGCFLKMMDL